MKKPKIDKIFDYLSSENSHSRMSKYEYHFLEIVKSYFKFHIFNRNYMEDSSLGDFLQALEKGFKLLGKSDILNYFLYDTAIKYDTLFK